MNKKLFLFLFLSIFLVSTVSAHFPEGHIFGTLKALETEPNTNFKTLCRDHLDVCLGFDVCGADSTVVHYLSSSGKEIYRGTHVKKAVDNCFTFAGNDDELRAGCIGWGLHLTQDPISHDGYTPEQIKKFFSTNLILHPPTERRVVVNLLNAYPEEAPQIEELVRTNCDVFLRDPKFLKLLKDSTGMDLSADVQIVDTALKGTGKYNSEQIWGKKIDLPNWWYYLTGGILTLSLTMFLAIALFGARFRKSLMIIWAILGIFAGIVLLSLILGTSYIWYNGLSDVLGFFINAPDWQEWWTDNIVASTNYLNSGNLLTTDASGLTYYEGNVRIDGALELAERNGKILLYSILIPLSLALAVLTFFAFRRKRK